MNEDRQFRVQSHNCPGVQHILRCHHCALELILRDDQGILIHDAIRKHPAILPDQARIVCDDWCSFARWKLNSYTCIAASLPINRR